MINPAMRQKSFIPFEVFRENPVTDSMAIDVDRAKRLVLVDGHGLAFRAFFALPPSMATSAGEMTNATYGFTVMLLDVLREHQPDYVLVTFDVGRTFRHEMAKDYKAHRAPMPDDLRPQIDRMKEVLHALNVPIYEAPGFEADDVIGTLSKQAAEQDIDAYVITGDSDLLQLVGDHVYVVMPGGRNFGDYRIYDPDSVRERYGFGPERVIDYKALVGDKSDNIPGVAGIGDKSAKDLIAQFSSIEEMFERLDTVAQTRTRNALSNGRDDAFHSRELATVVRDVPVELDLEGCRVSDFDRSDAIGIFQTLEFRTLLNKLPDNDGDLAEDQQVVDAGPTAEPVIINSHDGLMKLSEEIRLADVVAVDVETDSLNPLRTELIGIGIATASDKTYYVTLGHEGTENASPEEALELLGPALSEHPKLIAHNGKFDFAVLESHGYSQLTLSFDTMLAAYLLGETARGLKDLAFNRFGWQMTPITDLIGRGRNQITMAQVPVADAAPYCCADVEATIRLEPLLRKELEDREQIGLLDDIELPLTQVLVDMERCGIAVDVQLLEEMSEQLESQIDEITSEIYASVGHEFNVNSPAQLSSILFEEIGLPPGRKTKTGYSVNQEVLEGLQGAHDVVDLVLEYRSLSKLKSTYVDSLPKEVDPEDGRIHTTYNQTIAATGRLSSTNPNLQNIPARTALGRQVRKAFVTGSSQGRNLFDEEAVLFGADYSQQELRLLAHYSGDPALIEAFNQGLDIHSATAAEVFEVPLEEVTPEQRSTAKVVNFGIMYGMSAFGLSRDTGMERGEAQEFIDRYYERFKGVEAFIEETIKEVERKGYASTLFGRRRYLPDITGRGPSRNAAERAAINMPIQGTAADIMKLAMLAIATKLDADQFQSRMLLQVHDELIFEAPVSEVSDLQALVSKEMSGVVELEVPMDVEPKIGLNWDEMKAMT